jgi:hypothetical protein
MVVGSAINLLYKLQVVNNPTTFFKVENKIKIHYKI